MSGGAFEYMHRYSDFDSNESMSSMASVLEDRDRQLEAYLRQQYPGVPRYAGSTGRPRNPKLGQFGVDVTNRVLEAWDGAAWKTVLDPAWGPSKVYAGGFTGGWGIGNGAIESRYTRVPSRVFVEIDAIMGSTSSYVNPCRLLLPFAPARYTISNGSGWFNDSSASVLSPVALVAVDPGGPHVTPFALAAINQINIGGIGATFPWTWATNDQIRLSFDYEPA